MSADFEQTRCPEYRRAARERRFVRVALSARRPCGPAFAGRERRRQRAADPPQLAAERQLAVVLAAIECLHRYLSRGGEDAEGDREVESDLLPWADRLVRG
jgi:hypothetical protein